MALLEAIEDRTARVGVIGLGYVGLPLATTAAARGFHVTGFDIDPGKIEKLDRSESYIEAVSDKALADLRDNGLFSSTTDMSRLSHCDVILICVPTPLTEQREPNLDYVMTTAQTIARHLTPDTLVVLESTTYPGTTEEVLAPILSSSGLLLGTDFHVGFSPEREDPGNASYSTSSIPKIVAGLDTASGDLVERFYSAVVDKVVRVGSTGIAEAVKITENVFRAVNIALVNELKVIFDAMGIDVWEVIDGAATKPFGYMPFYPGPGLGGHCIPIDPFYLSWKARAFNVPAKFIELAGEINTSMPSHVVLRTREIIDQASGKGLSASRILLVGVAYKKNISDMRESPAMRLMQLLVDAGADVDHLDPHVPTIPPMREYGQFTARRAIEPESLSSGKYDAVLIATDHDMIDYERLLDLGCPVIDTRNVIERRGLMRNGVFKV